MVTDLETLLNANQLNQLIKAINANQEYEYQDNGLFIKANATDNSLCLTIAYDEDQKECKLAEQESGKFQSFLTSLDDELFIDTCEELGECNLQSIQECLSSNKLDTVRAGVSKFKMALSQVVKNKIEYLKAFL